MYLRVNESCQIKLVIRGIGGKSVKIPLSRISVRSRWKSGPITAGVVDKLLMKGISLSVRNDVGRRLVYPRREDGMMKLRV